MGEGMSAYAVFVVKAESKLEGFPAEKMEVERRYNDFFQLHKRLQEKYKSVIVPPIPEKDWHSSFSSSSSQTGNKFSKEFLQFRKRQLNNFLQCLASHQTLRECQEFKDFFHSSSSGREREKKSGGGGGGGGLGSLLSNVFGGAKSTVSNLSLSLGSGEEDPEGWFVEKSKQLDFLSQHLSSLSHLSNAWCNNLQLVSSLSSSLSPPFLSLSSLSLSPPSTSDSNSTNQDNSTNHNTANTLPQDFAFFAQTFAEIPSPLSLCVAKTAIQFRDVINFWIRYIANAKLVLQNRLSVLSNYQSCEKSLLAKKTSPNRTEVQKLELLFNDSKIAYEQFTKEARKEIENFERQFSKVMHNSLSNLAVSHLNLHTQMSNQFKTLLQRITH